MWNLMKNERRKISADNVIHHDGYIAAVYTRNALFD